MKKAFTMIELIFVIVILGILSSVAISKMAVTRDDAMIAKGRSQVAAIRNAITLLRNTNMLQGQGASWPSFLDDEHVHHDGEMFDGNDTIGALLDYPIYGKRENGHWDKNSATQYQFRVLNDDILFDYDNTNGQFDCDHTDDLCKALTE